MKKLLPFLLSFSGIFTFSQQIESSKTILNDKISIRAIEIYDNKVWYSGTDSKFGYVDLKDSGNQKQIKIIGKEIAVPYFGDRIKRLFMPSISKVLLNFFKIDKKSLKYEVVFRDTVKNGFL